MSTEQFLGLYNYWIVIFLMMTGFYIVIARNNLVKTIIGLNIFQISVILLYVSMGKISGGTAPIVPPSMVSHGHADVPHVAHADNHADARPHDLHSDETKDLAHDHQDDHDNEHDSHAAQESRGTAEDHKETDSPDALVNHPVSDSGHHAADSAHDEQLTYSNPLPSVLMLTAIVVGIATTALALALIVRIREDYGTIEEDEILEMDRAA